MLFSLFNTYCLYVGKQNELSALERNVTMLLQTKITVEVGGIDESLSWCGWEWSNVLQEWVGMIFSDFL